MPREAIDSGVTYLLKLQNDGDGGFSYTGPGIGSNLPRTGMALYVLERTGRSESSEAERAAKYILKNFKDSSSKKPYEFYGIFWGASGMALRGGKDAERYAAWMYPHCKVKQQADGSFQSPMGVVLPSISVALALSPED